MLSALAGSRRGRPQAHTVNDCGIVNKVDVDVFLELGFFDDPAAVGNLISGSSAFSKSGLNI